MKYRFSSKFLICVIMLGISTPAEAGWWDNASSFFSSISNQASARIQGFASSVSSSLFGARAVVEEQIRTAPFTMLGAATAVGASLAAAISNILGRRAYNDLAQRMQAKSDKDEQALQQERGLRETAEQLVLNNHAAAQAAEARALEAQARAEEEQRARTQAEIEQARVRGLLGTAEDELSHISQRREKDQRQLGEMRVSLINANLAKNQAEARQKELLNALSLTKAAHEQDLQHLEEEHQQRLQKIYEEAERKVEAAEAARKIAEEAKAAAVKKISMTRQENTHLTKVIEKHRNGPKPEKHPLHRVLNSHEDDAITKSVQVRYKAWQAKYDSSLAPEPIELIADFNPLDDEPRGTIALYCIHGTWSNASEFGMDPNTISSQNIYHFAQQLAQGYQKKVQLFVVSWSGALNANDRIQTGELLAQHCAQHFSNKNGEWPYENQLYFMAHSHGCNVASIAANRLIEQGKTVDRGIFIASPALDEEVEELLPVPTSTIGARKHHSFKDLLCFYTTGDFTQVAGSKESKGNFNRKLPLANTQEHKIRNIRLQYQGHDLDHVSIKWAVTQMLAKFIFATDTNYPLCFDLDANIGNPSEYPMIAIRTKNAKSVQTISALQLVEGSYNRSLDESATAQRQFAERYEGRSIESISGSYWKVAGTQWILNAKNELKSAGMSEQDKKRFRAQTVFDSWDDMPMIDQGGPSSPKLKRLTHSDSGSSGSFPLMYERKSSDDHASLSE